MILQSTMALADVPSEPWRRRPVYRAPKSELIRDAAFVENQKTLAVVTGPYLNLGTVSLLDTSTWRPRTTVRGVSANAYRVSSAPDGKTLAISGFGLFLWDVAERKIRAQPSKLWKKFHPSPVFSPDGKVVAYPEYLENALRCQLTTDSGKVLPAPDKIQLEYGRYWSSQPIAFSPDSKRLALACKDGSVRVWDISEQKVVLTLTNGHTNIPTAVAFGPDGKSVISVGADGRIIHWKSSTEKTIWRLPGLVNRIAQSSDRRYLFTSNQNGTIYVFCLTPAPKE